MPQYSRRSSRTRCRSAAVARGGDGLVDQRGRATVLDGETAVREIVNKRGRDVLDRREGVEVRMSDVLLDDFLFQVEEATLERGERLPVLGKVACESLRLRALVGGVDDDGALAIDIGVVIGARVHGDVSTM